MKTVDEYIAGTLPEQRVEFERIGRVVAELVPSVEQGTSYGMAAYMYKGKPLLSFVVAKNFLSLYPFSGKVVDKLGDKLQDFETTTGSIHFSVEHPVPEPLLKEVIALRMQEIDAKVLNQK